MSKVIQLRPSDSASVALRNIADMIDNGEIPNECTVIAGTEVFHCGQINDETAATNAIFNMTMGIQKLMRPVIDSCVE